MEVEEAVIREMFATVERECATEIELLVVTLPPLGEKFPRLTLKAALAAYRDEGGVDETKEPEKVEPILSQAIKFIVKHCLKGKSNVLNH